MLKIEGLDKLLKELAQAERAFTELEGELEVNFDPNDPASIRDAIRSMEKIIDERVGQYADNQLVAPMIDAAKEEFRSSILERASAARLETNDE